MFLTRPFFIIADAVLLVPFAHYLPICSSLLIYRVFFLDIATFFTLLHHASLILTCRNLASHLQTSFPSVDISPSLVFSIPRTAPARAISVTLSTPVPSTLALHLPLFFSPVLLLSVLVEVWAVHKQKLQAKAAVGEPLLLSGFISTILLFVYRRQKTNMLGRRKESIKNLWFSDYES